MANDWKPLKASDEQYIAAALCLLQLSAEGYNRLSVEVLIHKMAKPEITKSKLLGLWIYSFADFSAKEENLLKPLVSAFFFLRQVHRKGTADSEDPAYCLSVGAVPTADKGLTKEQLMIALVDVCKLMRPANTTANGDTAQLEVMHPGSRPKFRIAGENLDLAYGEFIKAGAVPGLASKGANGTIVVEEPWAPQGDTDFLTWLNIKEKP